MKKNKHTAIGGFFAATLLLISCNDLRQTINDTLKKENTEVAPPQPVKEEKVEEVPVEKPEEEPLQEPIVTQDRTAGFAADTVALQQVETALRNLPELKGKPINIYYSVHFYDNYRVLLRIQNPDNPNYVDEYYYSDQKWEGPKPVVTSARDNVPANVVSLDKIPFKTVHTVYKTLTQKMREIGNTSTDVTIYAITRNNRIKWYPRTISNQRSRYSIEFNTNGTLQSFEQE